MKSVHLISLASTFLLGGTLVFFQETPDNRIGPQNSNHKGAGQKVELGSDELTTGIPGSGPLTIDEVRAWLDDSRNHEPLNLKLPLGLDVEPNRLRKLPTPLTRAKIELGRQLFFDTRLSVDNTISCATCHDPDHGYTVHKRFAEGVHGQKGKRNPPTLINRIMFSGIGEEEFWDGHAASMEDAVLVSITDPTGMANSLEGVLKTLRRNQGYKMQFQHLYKGVTLAAIGDAVASFVRVIVTGASPFDYHQAFRPLEQIDPNNLKDESPDVIARYEQLKAALAKNPMSASALKGMKLYYDIDKAWCIACHVTPTLTDNKFHNIGVGMQDASPDLGRYLVTGNEQQKGAFKTPSLRCVTLTAPYMHDGRFETLEQVLQYYGTKKVQNPHLDPRFDTIRLTDQEQQDLIEFLKHCCGPLPKVERGRLP